MSSTLAVTPGFECQTGGGPPPFRRAGALPVVSVSMACHNLRTWGLLFLDLFKTGDGWVIF